MLTTLRYQNEPVITVKNGDAILIREGMGDESLVLGDSRLQQLAKKKTVIFAD